MFIPKASSFKLSFVFCFVDLLENILKSAIVFFEDSVLCCKIARIVAGEGVLHARVSEAVNRFISVIHAHHYTSAREIEDIKLSRFSAVRWSERHSELTGHLWAEISRSVLIAKGVSAHNNRLSPSRY